MFYGTWNSLLYLQESVTGPSPGPDECILLCISVNFTLVRSLNAFLWTVLSFVLRNFVDISQVQNFCDKEYCCM